MTRGLKAIRYASLHSGYTIYVSLSRNQNSIWCADLFALKFTEMKLSQLIAGYVVLFLLWESGTAAREIHISPSGNDSSDCTSIEPCKTLDHGLSIALKSNSAQLMLIEGNYLLNEPYSFVNMNTFGLHGTGDVKITCGNANVSLSFLLSNNISIERVTLQKCGGWHTSTYTLHKYFPKLQGALFKTALYFRYCRNLRVSDVEISHSPGLGANLYDVGGVVNVTNSVFANNSGLYDHAIGIKSELVYSGGGIFLMLNPYINNTLNVSSEEHDTYQHNNQYLFSNCHFLRNVAQWFGEENQELYTPARPFTLGGGLAVFFESNASSCSVKIQGCTFRNNNASWGGGLQVEFTNFSENNTLLIESTIFSDNFAASAGGGARIGNQARKSGVPLTPNRFYFINCSFIRNSAFWGGGASIFGTTILSATKNTVGRNANIQFHFSDCQWQCNNGSVGAAMAIYLYNNNEDQLGPEVPFHVQFDNGTLFESNGVHVHNQTFTVGQGSLYSLQVPLIFKNFTKFSANQKSALLIEGSFIDVHDQLEFINNTGFRGGAIAMYGRSRIIFYPKANVTFEGNTCDDKGGALYIQTPGPPLVSFHQTGTNILTCFFGYMDEESDVDYEKWDINVTFKENSCSVRYSSQCKGKSVYAATLKTCYKVGENRTNNSVLKWKFVKFDTSVSSAVSTDPVELQFDKSNWNVAPGEWFDADVKLLDELNNAVQGIILVTIRVSHGKVTIYNQSSCSLLTNDEGKIRHMYLKGSERSNFSLQINFVGSQLLRYVIKHVTLRNCYDGFVFCNETRLCKCIEQKAKGGRGISKCANRTTVFIKRGFWAGRVADKNGKTKFSTLICPEGYCNKTLVWNSNAIDYRYMKNNVCTEGRNQSSVLCGECDKNFGVGIGDEQCLGKCSNWYLFLIIPYGLGFLLVVAIIMLINLDVFTGYFNAWLYSYQVMNLLVPGDFQFNPVSQFLIDLSNIKIRVSNHSFCFAASIDDLDKFMLMYAIPVYVILVVIILAKLIGAYPQWCFSRRVRAPFRGICTIFVLCYTDITSISLEILRYANIGSNTVVYAKGSLDYFSGKHLGYGIVAILFILLFVIPFPMILLFRKGLTKGLRPVLNINRWNPFFDALQNCFKDQYRWCAAFYFICRLVILVIYTMMIPGPAKRLLLEGVCILIVLIFAFLKPYKEASDVEEEEENYEWMNRSDVVLLTTLVFIAVISSPLDYSGSTTKKEIEVLKKLLNILSFVPVAVLLVVGTTFAWKHLCHGEPEVELPPMSTTDSREATPVHTPESSLTQRGSRVSRNTSTEHSSLLDRRAHKPLARYGSRDSRSSYQTAEE